MFTEYVASDGTLSTPDGLVSGVNLFQSDGTELVAVGDQAISATVYAWQGATFTDLDPGEYRFTYIYPWVMLNLRTQLALPLWTRSDEVIRPAPWILTPAALLVKL